MITKTKVGSDGFALLREGEFGVQALPTLRIVTGDAGDNTLDGRDGGSTVMNGLGGNDSYVIDNAGDVVNETVGEGTDRVFATVDYALKAGQSIEVLSTASGSGTTPINLTGNEFAQTIIGNAGANTIDGGAGADIMRGGGGGDTYLVDNAGDQVFEVADGSGSFLFIDTVTTSVSYVLTAGQSIEALTVAESNLDTALNLTGNEFAQSLSGNIGNNILDGRRGADFMVGLDGNDTYIVDNIGDKVIERDFGGTDRVLTSVSYVLRSGQQIEGFTTTDSAGTAAINLTGNELGQAITGNAGANILDGAGGADTMSGLGGNDTYFVDDAGDVINETTGDDRVLTGVSYTLGAGQAIERLATTDADGVAAIDLSGNDFRQTIVGNAGDNRIDGGGGADTLAGLDGNDIYLVDDAGDMVNEAVGQGERDLIGTTVNYTLKAGQEIEALTTFDPANNTKGINLTGNEFAQVLQGSFGNDILDGKGGGDFMIGFDGDDTYIVDNTGDKAVEALFDFVGGGVDRVLTSVSYALGAGQAIEALIASDAAGTAALRLTGNEFAQTVNGNTGNNVIDGKGGADTLNGFGGNDTYFVNNAGDTVNEAANGGTDSVLASATYALRKGQAIEFLSTTNGAGTAGIGLTGNELAQTITGNAGANSIAGLGGGDTMIGLGGNDVYFVGSAGDKVIEAAGGGTDIVIAGFSYALQAGQSIETLQTLDSDGSTAVNLTGNEFAQRITGNAGANTIAGGAGNDTLTGFGGSDSFVFDTTLNAASNVDRITDFSVADDTVRLENAIFTALTTTGTLSASNFFAGTAAHDATDRILYNAATGALSYDADGTGAKAAIQFATIAPGLAVTHLDFFVL